MVRFRVIGQCREDVLLTFNTRVRSLTSFEAATNSVRDFYNFVENKEPLTWDCTVIDQDGNECSYVVEVVPTYEFRARIKTNEERAFCNKSDSDPA